MDDFVVYENFLPNVRMSLYGDVQQKTKPNIGNPNKSKKVKFSVNRDSSDLESQNSEKLKKRKATPFKSKPKKHSSVQYGESFSSKKSQKVNVSVHSKRKNTKNRKVVISFSDSESLDEDAQLSPSKSEMETFENSFNKPKRNLCCGSNSSNEEDECRDFDLETYFNAHDFSDLNESVTEAHSGIDHEFPNEYAKNVKIIGSECIYDSKKINTSDGDNLEYIDHHVIKDKMLPISDSMENSVHDRNIAYVTERIEESMIISDDNNDESSLQIHEDEPCEWKQEKKVQNKYFSAEYHEVEDKKIVILQRNQTISFHGLLTLKVLRGKLEILGHMLDRDSKEVDLYSPRGSAFLCINNITDGESQCDNENGSDNLDGIKLEPLSAAFICRKLMDSKILFIEKYIPQRLFPKVENNGMPQVCFESCENSNIFKDSPLWNKILESVNCDTKLMFTGGKGVGKSVLLRFAINTLLNKFPKVKVIDLDPGQSEFTAPGVVSITTVTEPVYGPNFTHLKVADRSLLSNINVGHNPRAYLKCIKSLILYLGTLEEQCPVLINCMGFTQGIGLNIISTAIKYICPTDIIQINSKHNNKNFKVDLDSKAVEKNYKLFSDGSKTYIGYSELKYRLHKIPAMNDENDGWTIEPKKSREMCVLSYFGQMMKNGVNSLTSHELPMYEIKLSEIKITNLQGEEISPAAANANMVALCSVQEESNIFVCLGYGIIRGIDVGCDKLVLITPEPATILEDVYYLVVGSVLLPPSIYMTPDDVKGMIPFVMEGELGSFGQITKRIFLPPNKK